MKNLYLTFISLLLFAQAIYSQKINYRQKFDDAQAQAKTQNKLLFVALTTPKLDVSNHPELKRSFTSGIDSPNVVKFYNEHFVNYTIVYNDSSMTALRKKYPSEMYPAYLFLDDRGNLVYKEMRNSSKADRYLNMGKKALNMLESGRTLSHYEDRYKQGNLTLAFLKDYIRLKEELGLYDNAKLADEYVNYLNIGSFNNYQEVLFVLQAGPYAYGKAYNLCYTNKKMVDSIYKTEPLPLRVTINSRIINNTMAEAIKTKNANLAQQVASFTSRSWQTNYLIARKEMTAKMLQYYYGVKDTANYLRQAVNFYDSYYMTISADSAKKAGIKKLAAMKQASADRRGPDTVRGKIFKPDTSKVKIIRYNSAGYELPVTNDVAAILNNAAYMFYDLGTCNQTYLLKAVLWSKRSVELNPTSASYDTMAHLLYRLNFFDEAISAQGKAITLANHESKKRIDYYKTELNKIKKHTI